MPKKKSTKSVSAPLLDSQTKNSRPQASQPAWKLFLLQFLLFALIVGVFFPATRNDFFYWYGDDPLYVTENSHVNTGLTLENVRWAFSLSASKSSAGVENSNLHPLTWISHMLACEIFGLKAGGHHLINVLLHAANTVLLFMLLKTMTGATWRSLAVALLFGLHPLRVESVAWISERKDVLSAFFWMLSLLFYARYALESKVPSLKSKIFYALALIGFACGLMSKTMVVTLPCVLLLLDYWPLQRWQKKNIWPLLLEKVPFFLLSGVLSILEVKGTKSGNFVQTLEIYTLAIRLENAVVSYGRYLGKMFWPVDLCSLYPHPGQWPMATIFMAAVFIVGISIFVFVTRRKWPWLLVGWCWYLGTLVPVIGLVQIGNAAMADRFSYIPMIGFLVALVWGLHEWTKRWRYQTVVWSAVVTVVLIFCVVITEKQIGYFKDGVTAWRHNFEVTGDVDVAQTALGLSLDKQGKTDQAIRELQAVVKARPNRSLFRFNLAEMLMKNGRVDEAITEYLEGINVNTNYNNLRYDGDQAALGQEPIDNLIFRLRTVMKHNRERNIYDPKINNALSGILASKGLIDELIECLNESVKHVPTDSSAHANLGFALTAKGLTNEAIHHLEEAIRLNPKFTDAITFLESVKRTGKAPAE